ncbi:MAG: DUF3352 domain-containing protein [Chloroflexus sp.]
MTNPNPFTLPPTTTPTSRRNQLPLLIGGIAIGLLLVLVGAGALVFNLVNQRSSAIPELLPAETQIYAAITPNLSDLPNIDRLRRAFPETFDYENTETTTDFLREQFGVTFDADIASWIGPEAAIAIYGIPIEQLSKQVNPDGISPLNPPNTFGPLNGITPRDINMLLIVAARNQQAAQAFLDKQRTFREQQGERFTRTTVGNVTIYTSESDETPFASFAIARDMVVFASNEASIRALIEQRSETALARNAQYQAVSQQLPSDRIGTIYIAGEVVARALNDLTSTTNTADDSLTADVVAASQALQGVGLTMAVINSGLRFDAVTVFDRNRLSNELRERLSKLRPVVSTERSGDVSSTAVGVLSFAIPNDWGQQLRNQLASSPDTANTLRDLENSLNLDLERDLFSWFHGEGVIAVLPNQSTDLPVTGYFALRVADQAAAKRGMQRLSELVEDLSGLQFSETSLGPNQVQAIEVGNIFVGYGFNGNDLVIALGRPAMEAAFGAEQKLANFATYTDALRSMPQPNSGVLYVNLTAARQLVNQLSIQPIDRDLEQRLAPFRAITTSGTAGIDDSGTARGTLLLSIEP